MFLSLIFSSPETRSCFQTLSMPCSEGSGCVEGFFYSAENIYIDVFKVPVGYYVIDQGDTDTGVLLYLDSIWNRYSWELVYLTV